MPIYEYYCSSCQQRFEKLSRMSDTNQPCPGCGQLAPKAISVPAPGQVASSGAAPACAASCGKTSGFG